MRSSIAKLFRQHLSPKKLLRLSVSYPLQSLGRWVSFQKVGHVTSKCRRIRRSQCWQSHLCWLLVPYITISFNRACVSRQVCFFFGLGWYVLVISHIWHIFCGLMSVIGVFQHHLMCISRYVICVHLQMYLKSQNFYQLKTPFFPSQKRTPTGQGTQASLVVSTGQCWSTHHFACLIGCLVTTISPGGWEMDLDGVSYTFPRWITNFCLMGGIKKW